MAYRQRMAYTSVPAPEEALAGMARIGYPREPMGNQAYMLTGGPMTGRATLMPRRNAQYMDPTGPGTKVNRRYASYGVADRNGARYGITVSYDPPMSIEASATQANGRIIPCCVNRERVNFDQAFLASM